MPLFYVTLPVAPKPTPRREARRHAKRFNCNMNIGRQSLVVCVTRTNTSRRWSNHRPDIILRVVESACEEVAEQVQLNLVGAVAGQIEVVERIAVRRNLGHVRHTVRVLPARRLGSEEATKRLSVGCRRLLPIGTNGVPAVAQPFLIGVAVLG